MTEEVLKAVEAHTNAIAAVNAGLEAERLAIENIEHMLAEEAKVDFAALKRRLADLKNLNAALPAAVVANVVPASAGPVGKSTAQHLVAQAEGVVAESLANVANATKAAQELTQHLTQIFEHLHQSANAIGAVKAHADV